MILSILVLHNACQSPQNEKESELTTKKLLNEYWKERLYWFPFEATAIGEPGYNDRLPMNIGQPYRDSLRKFFTEYLERLKTLPPTADLQEQEDRDILKYELEDNLESLQFPAYWLPVNQFWSFPLEFAQWGSGQGIQPFITLKDYADFEQRMLAFPAWIDTAIANMHDGIRHQVVLPAVLVKKMIPQMASLAFVKDTASIFFGPIRQWPDSLPLKYKALWRVTYLKAIQEKILPAYTRLHNFLKDTYLPAARNSHGWGSLPQGAAWYQSYIRHYTTTRLTPDSIYNLGLQEVDRISQAMDSVKRVVGFTGTLSEFFESLNNDTRFYPFSNAASVLDSFRAIQKIQEKHLPDLFLHTPKTAFEIRQTEAFRAASASAEYQAGSADGKRPGVFYVPVVNANKFHTIGMETLFLHEAIPGHHYQISLQQENTELPEFRRFLSYSAYAEGWALYTETLGPELGLFKNPYQYLGHLSDAMHRALRLVIDVGLHTRQWTREQAIDYMRAHERISAEEAEAEIERYMAIPGQALSYKIGELSLQSMKAKCRKKMGQHFDIRQFHEQVLKGGNMPLEILEKKLERWAERQ